MEYRCNIFKGTKGYLSTIIDLYDRHVVAYKISKHNDNKLVLDTLNEDSLTEFSDYIKPKLSDCYRGNLDSKVIIKN